MDLLEDKFIGGESSADFKKRVDLRNKYVGQCNLARSKFQKTVSDIVGKVKMAGRSPPAKQTIE